MIDLKYKRAYTEVIEILNYLPENEYSKIPKEKIDYYEKNRDRDYDFKINPRIPVERQKISKEANAILVSLFLDYFISDNQKEGLKEMLDSNE